jgi:NACHT domain
MDPLSITASVIAVLQAASTVVAVCYDFRAAINTQPWALSRIINSINELRLILNRLEQIANESESNLDETSMSRLTDLEVLCQEGGAVKNCLEELKALEKKLIPGNWAGKDGSKRRSLIQSIGWQLKGKEAEEILLQLDRCKGTLNLALALDQTTLIKNMNRRIMDVDENTRSLFKQFQDISLDDRKRSILRWLSPVDPSVHHEEALMVRQAGTNDWFLSSKEFACWIEAEKSFLWLSGFPGAGKTILMSTLIDFLQRNKNRKHPTLLAYFYCDFRSPETSDPLNLAGSLLAQVCFQLGSFPASLEAAFDRCTMSHSPYGKRINLATITEILIELGSQHQVTILVDGLDECQRHQDISVFFRQLGKNGTLLNILVSSRDEANIREALSEFPRMRLEAASACLDRDIDNYISHRLGNDSEFKWLKPSFQQFIREHLNTQVKGM